MKRNLKQEKDLAYVFLYKHQYMLNGHAKECVHVPRIGV